MGASNANVLVLAATNAPWNVDTALRRPGRFDRVVFVPPPDAHAPSAKAAPIERSFRMRATLAPRQASASIVKLIPARTQKPSSS